jgi:hypothetical protein
MFNQPVYIKFMQCTVLGSTQSKFGVFATDEDGAYFFDEEYGSLEAMQRSFPTTDDVLEWISSVLPLADREYGIKGTVRPEDSVPVILEGYTW